MGDYGTSIEGGILRLVETIDAVGELTEDRLVEEWRNW